MVQLFLISLIILLLIYGRWEYFQHQKVLANIPIRIHINGSRGKSSVTRLVGAGLRAGGLKTLSKTTGSAPRVIDMAGNDRVITRLRSASIGEQVKLLKMFSRQEPDAVVMECMAVMPQYQWVAEHQMVKSTIGVITNVRPDHIGEMGSTLEDIANSLANTIPKNGVMITAENRVLQPLINRAKKNNCKLITSQPDDDLKEELKRFPYLEHDENIALALKVCEQLGIDRNTALEGMITAKPDPGALVLWNLKIGKNTSRFVSAFAANDPQSTLKIWNLVKERIDEESISVFLNTRADRRHRTRQLIDLIYKHISPHVLIIRGEHLPPELSVLKKKFPETIVISYPYSVKPNQVVEKLKEFRDNFIFGIGNIVGWGEEFVSELKRYRVNG